jgi:hypothetical protein
MHLLVLMTVKSSTSVYEDGWNLLGFMIQPEHPLYGPIRAVCDIGHDGMGGLSMVAGVHYRARIMGT